MHEMSAPLKLCLNDLQQDIFEAFAEHLENTFTPHSSEGDKGELENTIYEETGIIPASPEEVAKVINLQKNRKKASGYDL